MSTYAYFLSCTLDIDPAWVTGVSLSLELTLPCMNCKRDYRTVIFEKPQKDGICTPQSKCSGFPGKIVRRSVDPLVNRLEIHYELEFEYEPFMDEELGKEPNLGKYGWARIYFSACCPGCHKEEMYSVQENAIRPRLCNCSCGKTLFREEESPFAYSLAKKEDH